MWAAFMSCHIKWYPSTAFVIWFQVDQFSSTAFLFCYFQYEQICIFNYNPPLPVIKCPWVVVHNWTDLQTKYVNIYRSISKLSYIDRYMISNIDRYMKFSKNHFSTDICRKFSFFDRYMKFFIFHKIIIFGFYSFIGSIKTSYIGHYNNAYIGLYKNVYKTLGDLAYIDLYTPYRFAA